MTTYIHKHYKLRSPLSSVSRLTTNVSRLPTNDSQAHRLQYSSSLILSRYMPFTSTSNAFGAVMFLK